ncbi:hypothetical protein OIV83_002109 [Microbotryomycetes sp. JL201]|nr:hypothetical protein OIV83_002109 [Microbotryomycetes sp. JL201]
MSTHHGFINEFPWIRVDAFDKARKPPEGSVSSAHVYLLTHCHTDHIVGLDSPLFSGIVYMTEPTKTVILNTATAGDRVRHEEMGSRLSKKFANLLATQAQKKAKHRAADSIRIVTLNAPFTIAGPAGETVTVTALDANHCIGSCMYLIEGQVNGVDKAVLVTGDIRAEDWWTTALRHNPAVAKYVHWPNRGMGSVQKPRLDCVYIDTSSILDEELVPKADAVTEVCKYISEYPPTTRFFINAWTWGYEELLKGIRSAFNERVWGDGVGCFVWPEEHMSILRGPKKLKRPGKAVPEVGGVDPKVVYLNPLEMPTWQWKEYKDRLDEVVSLYKRKAGGETLTAEEDAMASLPDYLITPLARHSTLPELQRLVSIFRPRTLYPLTMDVQPGQPCVLYPALASCFRGQLDQAARSRLQMEGNTYQQRHFAGLGLKEQEALEVERCSLLLPQSGPVELNEVHLHLEGVKDRNRLLSAATLNVEGPPEAIATINSWLLVKKGERFPPISPSRSNVSEGGIVRQNSVMSMSPPTLACNRKLTFGASQERVIVLSDGEDGDEEDKSTSSIKQETSTALLPALALQPKRQWPLLSGPAVQDDRHVRKKIAVKSSSTEMHSAPVHLSSEPSSSAGESSLGNPRPSANSRIKRHKLLKEMLHMMGNGRFDRDGSVIPLQEGAFPAPELKHQVLAEMYSQASDENQFAY